jgi:hypothetical protein
MLEAQITVALTSCLCMGEREAGPGSCFLTGAGPGKVTLPPANPTPILFGAMVKANFLWLMYFLTLEHLNGGKLSGKSSTALSKKYSFLSLHTRYRQKTTRQRQLLG